MAAPDVWVARDDGTDIIRATAIAGVSRDYDGNVTVRMSGGEQAAVTLVTGHGRDQPSTPEDFHLKLLRLIAELSDTAEPAIIRPARNDAHGWEWQTATL
jgi:hypothetical protein